jgi:hypothetical protein
MTVHEIKHAVDSGRVVCWQNTGYRVEHITGDGYVIRCLLNNSLIGLTWRDGVTLNGQEDEFYIYPALKPGLQVRLKHPQNKRESELIYEVVEYNDRTNRVQIQPLNLKTGLLPIETVSVQDVEVIN